MHGADKVAVSAVKDKSCRDILDMLSAGACGVWYCGSDNELSFLPFGVHTSAVSSDSYSRIKSGTVKGPISRVVTEDDGEVFDTLGGGNVQNMIRTESIFASAENAAGILAQCKEFTLQSFSCKKAKISGGVIDIGGSVTLNNADYTILACSLSFTPAGVFAELSCPELNEAEYDYLNYLDRSMKQKITAGKAYKNAKISKYEGFSFIGRN